MKPEKFDRTELSRVYSRLCSCAWDLQESERKGRPREKVASWIEDLILVYAELLDREPPQFVLDCYHD